MDSRRVLLVDDDNLVCISLEKGLERKGYAVTTAESGNRAVAVLEKEPFDIVVADLVMNDVDGLGVLKRCKELRPETAVIILTAFADLPSAVEPCTASTRRRSPFHFTWRRPTNLFPSMQRLRSSSS